MALAIGLQKHIRVVLGPPGLQHPKTLARKEQSLSKRNKGIHDDPGLQRVSTGKKKVGKKTRVIKKKYSNKKHSCSLHREVVRVQPNLLSLKICRARNEKKAKRQINTWSEHLNGISRVSIQAKGLSYSVQVSQANVKGKEIRYQVKTGCEQNLKTSQPSHEGNQQKIK